MTSWEKPFDVAFEHKAALAESAYKKLRLVGTNHLPYGERLKIFQSAFIPTLIYGSLLPSKKKHLRHIDTYYINVLRRIVGSKLQSIQESQTMRFTVEQEAHEHPRIPFASSSFKCSGRLLAPRQTNRYIMWFSAHPLRTVSKLQDVEEAERQRHFQDIWNSTPANVIFGPNVVYGQIARSLRTMSDAARAALQRARH